MAKTLGKLRTQTLKLKELEPPKDVSKGTKAFVRKHVYVVHPDANENGDDVFRAKNIKKSKRSPDHGYEPGEDEDIYEGSYKDIDTDEKEKKRLARAKDSVTMKKGRTRAVDFEDDHRASRRAEGGRLKSRMRSEGKIVDGIKRAAFAVKRFADEPSYHMFDKPLDRAEERRVAKRAAKARKQAGLPEETEDLGEGGGLATLMAVRAITKAMRNDRVVKRGRTPKKVAPEKKKKLPPVDTSGYWNQKEETNLDEILGLPAIVSALRGRGSSGGNDASYRAKTAKLKAKRDKGELLLKPSMQDPEQREKMLALNAKVDRLAQYKTDMAAVAKRQVAKKYWGEESEMYIKENVHGDFGGNSVEDRNSEHHYLHHMILDHLDQIHKTLQKHVSLMDNMTDAHHEVHYNRLDKLCTSVDDLSEKVYQIHQSARTKMGMNPTPPNEGNRDLGGKPMVGNAFPHSEGFEHIANMSESDQALLVDTYNSLTEDNQERFLELAESEEGCDKLLDFCITSRGND